MKTYDCGIDLGTTNSCIAVANEDGEVSIIENSLDQMKVTPSVVRIHKGRTIVGKRAYDCPFREQVRREFKRDMGSDTVYTFPGGIEKSPAELSGEVLKVLKSSAETKTGKEMRDAVITVPAGFNEEQIRATKEAARLAGFENVILPQEPVAAARAYGACSDADGENWMVIDYGGGTLDVAVVSAVDGQLIVRNNAGNNRMGGKDLDRAIFEKIVLPKLEEEQKDDIDPVTRAVIMSMAERCKIALTGAESTQIDLFELEELSDICITVTRKDFEDCIAGIIDEVIDVAKIALAGAKIEAKELTSIILVGGSTYVPLVRRRIEEEFKLKPKCDLDPMTVVAQGACYIAMDSVIEGDIVRNKKEEKTEVKEGMTVSIIYDPVIEDDETTVTIKLSGYPEDTMVNISEADKEDPDISVFQTGWSPLSKQGVIQADLFPEPGRHFYRISAMDGQGRELTLKDNEFSIQRIGGLSMAAPPLPFNIGVMAMDERSNIADWILEKNTLLPCKGSRTYRINKDLDPMIPDDFRLVVYEGDNRYNPKANHMVGIISVRSDSLPEFIKEGTEVEITLSVDISRIVEVNAYIPSLDLLLGHKALMGSRNYTSYLEEVRKAASDMKQTIEKMEKLEKKGIDISEEKEKMRRLNRLYNELGQEEMPDNDKADSFIKQFRELETGIIKKERGITGSIKENEAERIFEGCRISIERYGNEKDMRKFIEYRDKYEKADNEELKEFYLNKTGYLRKEVEEVSRQCIKDDFSGLCSSSMDFVDREKAEKCMEDFEAAEKEGNIRDMRNIVNNLGILVKWPDKERSYIDRAHIRR